MTRDRNSIPTAVTADQPSRVAGCVRDGKFSAQSAERDPFATDHLLANLKGRTISSGFVTVLAQVAVLVLNVASVMVLARILTPRDFGLVAMVTTVLGFLRVFNDAGLSTATVQREGITHAQISNLFWTNVALGGLISLLLAVSAPAVAWFYGEPRLVDITLALSATVLLTTSAVQHMALLRRQMRFKVIALIEIGSMSAGVLVGIGMARLKCGYWSLVGMQVTTPAVTFLLTWSVSRWRPQLPRRHSGTRSLLTFGANLTASSLIWSLARGSDALLIGKVYGSASLGLYSRAAALLMRPVEQLLSHLNVVFVPTFSRLQSDPERYRRVFLRVYDAIGLISFPFTALLLALAQPITLVVLGSKWEKAAAIFAGFTFTALYAPFSSAASWLFTSQGRGKDHFVAHAILSTLTFVAILVGLPFGVAGVAIATSATGLLIRLPLLWRMAGRRGPVRTRDLVVGFFQHLRLWFVVLAATWLTQRFAVNFTPLTQLLVSVPAGLLAGACFILVSPSQRQTAIAVIQLFSQPRRN